jgi:hypothetical protein
MKPGLSWLASMAALPLIGWPVAFARPFRALPTGCRLALAGGVGGFLLSTVMTASALLGIRWTPALLVAVAFLVSAGVRRLLSREDAIDRPTREPHGVVSIAGALVSAAAVATVTLSVMAGASTSGDLILFWGPKAQAFAAVGTIDAAFLKERFLEYLHPSYPPLVTNIFAFASMVAGRFEWGAATATLPLTLAGLAVALPGVLRLGASRAASNAIGCVVVCGLGLIGMETDVAGSAEMPLLFFETLALALLISPSASRPPTQLLAGLLLGGAAATKVEGMPVVLAASVLFLVLKRTTVKPWPALLRLLGPTAIAVGLWFAFGAWKGAFRGYRGYGDFFDLHFAALGTLLLTITRSLWLIGYGLPFLIPISLLVTRRRPWNPALLPLGTALALAGFLVFTYLHVAEPAHWIDWSAARVFSPLVPLLSLAAVACDAGGVGSPREAG